MKHLPKLLLLAALLVGLMVVLALPAAAQQEGVIVQGSFAGPDSLSPIYCLNTNCSQMINFMFPTLVNVDPQTAFYAPGAPLGLAESWEISDDGLTYTFTLRDDYTWTDGTPVTSADVKFTWDAIVDPETASDLSFIGATVDSFEAPDPQTLIVNFNAADCTAFGNIAINVAPAHLLGDIPHGELQNSEFEPVATAGVFSFGEYRAADVTTLLADPSYADAINGEVLPLGYIQKVVPDSVVEIEQLLAGEINIVDGPDASRVQDLRDSADVQTADFPGASWDYLALNYADPDNPQAAFDEDGNKIEQDPHPLFADVRVRRALALALNVDDIMEGAVFGEGFRMTANLLPTSSAYNNDLPPIGFDPDAAAALLEEAGWIDEDGDGVREAHGAMFAEDGTPFEFTLLSNEGNSRRASIGTIAQDQWSQIGVKANFQTMESNAFFDFIFAQTFDAAIAGWRNGFPDDPDSIQLFGIESDIPIDGGNLISWDNPEAEVIQQEALTLPGCDAEGRNSLYRDFQVKFQEDVVYIPLFTRTATFAAGTNIGNWDPLARQLWWNVETWDVRES